MSEQESVRVNFGTPFPLFPLRQPVLLPHAVVSLFVFEERYRQMTSDVLDGSGQIAMAVYEDPDDIGADAALSPPLKPAVCVGQIVHHQQNPDGTYSILLQGVCRAEIVDEDAPNGERLYRQARLQPIETGGEALEDSCCAFLIEELNDMLSSGPVGALEQVQRLREQLDERDDELPPDVFFDLMALCLFSMLEGDDLRYQLLAETDPKRRAKFIHRELKTLNDTLENAERQFDPEAPKGVSWN